MNPTPDREGKARTTPDWRSSIGPFLTMGLELAFAVVGMYFVGYWLDGLWDTAPWLSIAGMAVGTIGGFLRFFRKAIALGRQQDREAEHVRERKVREG